MALYHKALTTPLPDPEELRQRMRYLKKVQAKLEKRLADAPEGSLVVNRKGNTVSVGFYHLLRGQREYLEQSRKEEIRKLAQKEYDQKALRRTKEEIKMIQRLISYLEMPKLEDVYDRCKPEKQEYIDPVILSDEEFRQAWLAQKFIQKDQNDGKHIFPTERGDMVCSKSEGMEADYMFYHKYDYKYEKQVELIDRGRRTWRYPDFTILDPVTRKEVIFEHFGMVDDENYARNMFDKIRLYEENGYIIGQNFLFTFETAEHPFTMDQFIRILEARFGSSHS